jgi:hypothetical protein
MSSKKLSKKTVRKREALEALKLESERDLIDQIRRLQARPMHERTQFLRRRSGLRGSAI